MAAAAGRGLSDSKVQLASSAGRAVRYRAAAGGAAAAVSVTAIFPHPCATLQLNPNYPCAVRIQQRQRLNQPVHTPVRKSQRSCCTSRGICPADWQASRRYGTPAADVSAPTAAASYTRPLLVGMWLMDTRAGLGCRQVGWWESAEATTNRQAGGVSRG